MVFVQETLRLGEGKFLATEGKRGDYLSRSKMTAKRSIPSSEGVQEIFSSPDKKFSTENILVLSKSNSHGVARIGVAIRKKDTKLAVKRNSIKRKIKGSFLSKVLELPTMDFVVYVKKNLTGKEKDLQKDLDRIWDKFQLNK